MRIRASLATLAAALLLLTGCGADEEGKRPTLIVSAAASLKDAFEAYSARFPAADVRYSFAGSDELAAQIRQGARPDIFAAANTRLPADLFEEGLVERPVVFAANRLVIAVPAGSSDVQSLGDLERPGVELVVGAPSVPAGSYAREALDRLPSESRERILRNVRSNEPNVTTVVGKLTQGAADAGFVYFTDVRGAKGELEAIELPRRLRPQVDYAVAVLVKAKQPGESRAFVSGLLSPRGRAALRAAGFERASSP